VASQTDIAPTLLAMLGGEYEQGFMGRNLLDVEEGDGFAFLHENDRMAFVRENYAVIMPPRNPASLYQTNKVFLHPLEKSQAGPDLLESLQEQMISCYQMARRLYRDRCYRSPNEIAADPVWPLAAE
jgi:phosphoglycerol transferase MdoB-like AlkP superfamily enzyme